MLTHTPLHRLAHPSALALALISVVTASFQTTLQPSHAQSNPPQRPALAPASATYDIPPDPAHQQRRLSSRPKAAGVFKPFSADLYSGSQANTRQSFGYGLYIVSGWAADAPVISSWFLDAIEPDRTNFPGLSPLWRWSEIDWEFVPYTVSPQREHIVLTGTLPHVQQTVYRSDYTTAGCPPVVGHYNDDALARSVAQVWNGSGQTRTPMTATVTPNMNVTPNTFITVNTFTDLATLGPIPAQEPGQTVGYGFISNPSGNGPKYWWSQAYPSFLSTWPLPCSLPLPTGNLTTSVAINVFRMPPGALLTVGNGPNGAVTSTVLPDIDQGLLPDVQPKPGAITNEAFVWARDASTGQPTLNPYTGWHTYTVAVTPDFVAFYIDAGPDGTDVQNSTPVRKMSRTDPANPFTTLSALGPNMIGGDLTFQDYYTAPQPMGNLRFMLQNWVDGNGWSGPQPPADFQKALVYVRTLDFRPLKTSTTGNNNADYGASTYSIDATTWTSDTWRYALTQNFKLLYSGNPEVAGTQGTSPNQVAWQPAPDGTPAIAMGLTPIKKNPPADFFVIAPGGTPGQARTYVAARIDIAHYSFATAAFPQVDVFWGPYGVDVPIKVWLVSNPAQSCTVKIKLNRNKSWTSSEASGPCAPVLPAIGTTTKSTTVGLGLPFFGLGQPPALNRTYLPVLSAHA